MVQAATTGVVDFGRADPRDPKWWRYLRLIINQLEQENLKEYYRLYNERTVSVLGRTDLTQESAERLLADSDARIDSIAKILFPWVDKDRDASRMRQVEELRSTWESWFGKMDDPDTQRRIRETAELLRSRNIQRSPRNGRR